MEKARELSESNTRKVGLRAKAVDKKFKTPASPASVGEKVSREEAAVLFDRLACGLNLKKESENTNIYLQTNAGSTSLRGAMRTPPRS